MNEFDRNPGIVPPVPPDGPPTDPAKPVSLHHGMVVRLRNYFLTGLVLVGPAYITISLTWWFINWVDDLVRPFIPIAYRPDTYLPVKIPGTGLIIALTALTLLGFLTANFVGRKLVEAGENILNRMPVVRPIYKSLKQIFETLFANGGSSFRRVGLVEFPSPGMWSLVFLANPASAHVAARLPATESGRSRSRHHGRSGNDAPDVGWHGAARRRRPAEETGRACRDCSHCASRAIEPHRRPGEVILACPDQPDRLVTLEQVEQMT
jgi:hypothetical protein